MIILPYNYIHFTCQQGNAQNPSSQASAVVELRTFMCTSWISKRKRCQISNCHIHWIMEKMRDFQKNIYCFIDYAKAFDCVDNKKWWKILKEVGIPEHLTCLLRNLYADQEASQNQTWNNRLAPNLERSISRLYIVTLLIQLLCIVHHVKCWAR